MFCRSGASDGYFFQQDNHLNVVLPSVLKNVFRDLLVSLHEIITQIANRWNNHESYFEHHHEIVQAIEMADKTGGFMKFTPSGTWEGYKSFLGFKAIG